MKVTPAARPMRLAIVYGRPPLPMTRADQMTVAHLIAYLSARGHTVDLFTLGSDSDKPTERQRRWLNDRCRTVDIAPHGRLRCASSAVLAWLRGKPMQVGWFSNPRQKRAVRERVAAGAYDVVYTYYVRSAEATRAVAMASGESAQPATYLAMQLSQSLNTKRIFEHATRLRDKIIYGIEHRLMRRYEAGIWREFSRVVLIGQNDVDEIRAACREHGLPEIDNQLICAHGVDIERFRPRPDEAEERTLVFSGVMATNTNVEAVTWFVRHCWPMVKAAVPGVRLYIVGRAPQPGIVAMGEEDPAIIVTGEVADPAEYIAKATVCINPMQAGAGMQNKLIEYLSSGKAVIATAVANEGVKAKPDVHLIETSAADDFARATIALLGDPARRAKLGSAARAYIESQWTWEKLFEQLEADMLNHIGAAQPLSLRRALHI